MKKFVFLFAVSFFFVHIGFAQGSVGDTCVQSFQGQVAKGYNALAMAIDNGFVACGFSFGQYDKGSAAEQAVTQCEQNRLNPANEIQGKRKIMTHCRVFRFRLVE